MSFMTTVKYVRKQLDLSQAQLARELNISFSTVNRWENGKTIPSQMGMKIFHNFCKQRKIDLSLLEKEGT